MSRTDFEIKLQSLADQGTLLSRICKTRTLDDVLKVITAEGDRLKAESDQLQKEAKQSGLI